MNLYAYAGNNPVGFSDPFGLSADTIEVRWHEVAGTGKNHASIRIAPDDQERWRSDPRFQAGADGRVSVTLGAGPKACIPVGSCLVSELNRPTDVEGQDGTMVLNIGNQDENEVISSMLRNDARYGDNLRYKLFPSAGGQGWNSNSYASGMLAWAGIKPPALPANTFPGWGKTIPLPIPGLR